MDVAIFVLKIINMFLINWILSLYMMLIMVLIIIVTLIYRHFSKIAFSEERKH